MRERETVERSIGDLPTMARSLGEMPTLDPDSQPTTVKLPVLKDYVLEKELGRGTFGVVYLAYHRDQPDIPLAMKVLVAPGKVDRLLQEPAMLARLDHPCIVRVLDYFTQAQESQLVIVLEYINGGDLKEAIEQVERFPSEVVREVLIQIGGALVEAHNKGIVHRDLKPANILIDRSGSQVRYVLTDFGVGGEDSGLRSEKKLAGTLLFMSPEQLRGRPGPQSDLWALGVTAYRMLTGKYPFPGPTLVELSQQIQLTTPALPSQITGETIDPELERTVLKLLDRSETERIGSAQELLQKLGHRGEAKSVLTHRTVTKSRIEKRQQTLDEQLRRGIRWHFGMMIFWIIFYIAVMLGPLGILTLSGLAVFYLAHSRWTGWKYYLGIAGSFSLYLAVFFAPDFTKNNSLSLWLMSLINTKEKYEAALLTSLFGLGSLVISLLVPAFACTSYAKANRLRRERLLVSASAKASPDEYLALLKHEVQFRYEDANFHLRYAEALAARGDHRGAAIEARLIQAQDPYHFNANLLLAQSYFKLGLHQDCVKTCEDYLEVSGYCFEFTELRNQCQGTIAGAA
jgi:serine/threonine protein kinase